MTTAGIQNLPPSRQPCHPVSKGFCQKRGGKIIFLVAFRQLIISLAVKLPNQRPFARAGRETSRVRVLTLESGVQLFHKLAHEAHAFFNAFQIQYDLHKAVPRC